MKIFVAGIATETNTFSPIPTALNDFAIARSLEDDAEVSCGGVSEIAKLCAENGDDFVHGLLAFAEPSGLTVRSAYESLRNEIIEQLKQHPDTDVVLLLLHGAMVAEGYEDCEADLAQCCKAVVPKAIVGVELDLHGHIDQRLLDASDVIKSYKQYPHVDIAEVAGELYDVCRRAAMGEVKPVTALVDCRMVGLFSTFREPVKSFVDSLIALEREPGVLAVSFNHGFPWGDVPHNGAKMLVVTDNNIEQAQNVALDCAQKIFTQREAARLPSVPIEEALTHATTAAKKPVVVADQSDNPGGGAPADSTFALRWLLDHKVESAGIAFIYDPEVVKIALAAGEGAVLPLRVGGKTSPASGDPVDVTCRVVGIQRGYYHEFPQENGSKVMTYAGDCVALETQGIYLIVNTSRCQCFAPSVFPDLAVPPLDIYIPKSINHFMSGFGPMAGEVVMMAAPGAIVPIMTHIEYQTFQTDGFWPWTEDTGPVLLSTKLS